MQALVEHLLQIPAMDWAKMVIMWVIGGILIFLAIKKDMEPTLLLPYYYLSESAR